MIIINKKDSILKLTWHYCVATILTFISLGCIRDKGILEIFAITDIAFILYVTIYLQKHFSITYIILIFFLHESFSDLPFGIGIICYVLSIYGISSLSKASFVRLFRVFNSEKMAIYFFGITIYVVSFDTLVTILASLSSAWMCVLQIPTSILLCYAFEYVYQKATKRKKYLRLSTRSSISSNANNARHF